MNATQFGPDFHILDATSEGKFDVIKVRGDGRREIIGRNYPINVAELVVKNNDKLARKTWLKAVKKLNK